MSTLRISNIEAKSVPASATVDEKVKITNSSGDVLVFLDGKTSGITTVGINTTDGNITFDANSNVVVTGIITATKFVGTIEPTSLEIGSNIKLGNAGVITATSYVGDGSALTGIDATQIQTGNTSVQTVDTGSNGHVKINTEGAERLRIDSSGRMIIGTVKNVNSGTHYDDLTINNSNQSGASGSTGIDLVSSDDAYGAIIFSDNSAYEQGYIKYVHNSNYDFMKFGTNSNDRWNLSKDGHWHPVTDSSYDIGSNALRVRNGYFDDLSIKGNVGIGNTTTVGRNAGVSTATGALIYNTTTNALEVYNGSSWLSVTSKVGTFNISYLVVGGGGAGGGNYRGGGGGAGALRTNWNNETQGGGTSSGSAKSINIGTSYAIGVGTAGVGRGGTYGWSGATSTFDDIVSKGGGGGGRYNTSNGTEDGRPSADPGGGSGGGGGGGQASSSTGVGGASGTYGYSGGNGSPTGGAQCGGGGGGAGAVGVLGGGGGSSECHYYNSHSQNRSSGHANGSGGSGVVVIRVPI